MFQQFWEAAGTRNGKRPDVIILSKKVGDDFAVTEVRLIEEPTAHPVIVAFDARFRRFNLQFAKVIGALWVAFMLLIGITITIALKLLWPSR
jgi:hypothetical protein